MFKTEKSLNVKKDLYKYIEKAGPSHRVVQTIVPYNNNIKYMNSADTLLASCLGFLNLREKNQPPISRSLQTNSNQ